MPTIKVPLLLCMHLNSLPGSKGSCCSPGNSIRSFCAIAHFELDASCLVTANNIGEVNNNCTLRFRMFNLEEAICHLLVPQRVPSSSSIVFSSGCLLSLVLFTRAPFPALLFLLPSLSLPLPLSLSLSLSLYILSLLPLIIRYSSLHIHPNYWQIACSYSLHSPYLLLTSYPLRYSSPSPFKISL